MIFGKEGKAIPKKRKPEPNGAAPAPKLKRIGKRLKWAEMIKLYPSLAGGPTPAQRRKKLTEQARARGIKPFKTIEEVDKWIEEAGTLWESDEEIDEFIAWVHRGRKQGFYD